MNCDRARKLLPLFAGEDLDAKDSGAVEEHVARCPECRAFSEELSGSLAWLRSAGAPPASEAEYAEMRRRVWRRVGERGSAAQPAFLQWRKAAFAAAVVLTAIVGTFLFYRRAPRETAIVAATSLAPNIPTPAAVLPGGRGAAPSPLPYDTEAGGLPAPRVESPPAEHVATNSPGRVRRQRSVRGESAGVDRIEFRTANPNVRIIWLVRKGEDKSSSLKAGRIEEVS